MKYVIASLVAVIVGLAAYVFWLKCDPIPSLPTLAKVQERIRTVTQTVTKPGGETVVTQTIESVKNPPRMHKVGVGVQVPWDDPKGSKTYEFNVYRRVFENTWLGVGVTTDREVKASLQIEF